MIARCDKAGIVDQVCDEHYGGNMIWDAFQGQLKESPILAVEAILKHETGILHVATALKLSEYEMPIGRKKKGKAL